jgi:DivIVA domain-containing protein
VVTALTVLGVLVVLFAAAVLATRETGPELAEAPADAADLALPPGRMGPDDVARLRFSMAPRGYRMEQVDLALDRLAAEMADRDRRIAELEKGTAVRAEAAPGPERHAPLPPADLATELVAEEREEQGGHDERGSTAATSDVPPDALLAALEEAGEHPHGRPGGEPPRTA